MNWLLAAKLPRYQTLDSMPRFRPLHRFPVLHARRGTEAAVCQHARRVSSFVSSQPQAPTSSLLRSRRGVTGGRVAVPRQVPASLRRALHSRLAVWLGVTRHAAPLLGCAPRNSAARGPDPNTRTLRARPGPGAHTAAAAPRRARRRATARRGRTRPRPACGRSCGYPELALRWPCWLRLFRSALSGLVFCFVLQGLLSGLRC